MNDNIVFESIACPVCNSHLFDGSYTQKKMYVCRSKKDDGNYCDHILAYCKTCDKIYDQEDFGLHGDVWECKECGRICWPLTDKRRKDSEKKQAKQELKSMVSSFNNTFGKMGF